MSRAILVAGLLAAAAAASAQENRFEPNQTRRTAARIPVGDYKLQCNQDDWFVIDVPEKQRLELSIRFTHAEGDLDLEVQDGRGRALGWSKSNRDEELVAVVPEVAMPVFFRVGGANQRYELHVGLAPSQFDGNQSAEVGCWGSDWYPLEVKAGQELRADLTFAHAAGDLDLAVFDLEGNELAVSSGRQDNESLRWTARQDQRVLLHVYHVHRARSPYLLKVRRGSASIEDLARVFRMERPQGAGNDRIELQGGEVLAGKILNSRFRLATPYADLELTTDQVAGIDLEPRGGEVQRLVTVQDDRFSGFLRERVLEIQVEGIPQPVKLAIERATRLVFGKRGNERRERTGKQLFTLRNGDRFSGRLIGGEGWTLDMEFVRLPVALDLIDSFSFESSGHVTVLRRDQTSVRGRLSVDELTIELDGPQGTEGAPTRFTLHPARLSALHLAPEEVGALGRAQLRHLITRLAGQDVPRDLLADLIEGRELGKRLKQLRGMVKNADAGNLELERHLLGVEETEARFGWFEVLLRIDRGLRERLVKLLGDPGEGEDLRGAAAMALVDLAANGGQYEPLERACDNPIAANLVVQAAMAAQDQNLTDWLMNRVRRWRGGRGLQVDDKAREKLMQRLPALLEEKE